VELEQNVIFKHATEKDKQLHKRAKNCILNIQLNSVHRVRLSHEQNSHATDSSHAFPPIFSLYKLGVLLLWLWEMGIAVCLRI